MSDIEHIDVLIVGAGLSGIDAAYRLKSRSSDRRWAIFEARDAIGGTWDLFRYPGVRSDSDMATLGFPFRPWHGEKAIAAGADIRDYIRETAREFGIDRSIRLRHRVTDAAWSSPEARWTVSYIADGEARRMTCGLLFLCSGYYDYGEGHAPTWPGIEAFRGKVVHPQFWPENLSVAGLKVLVIGSGATAVTLVPALARRGAAHVTMLQRSPTYIVSRPSHDEGGDVLRRRLPMRVADAAIRWKNIGLGMVIYKLSRSRPEWVKRWIADHQKSLLGPDLDARDFTPRYDPWDQRLCIVPDGDLFEALRTDRATIVTDEIDRFTPDGVRLRSGDELAADLMITATGLKVRLMGGATLSVDGETVDPATRLVYKGAMLDGVPNFAFAVGYTNASWTLKCDLTARFVSRLLNHMAAHGQDCATPVAPAGEALEEPMLDLRSGYVKRAQGLLPRQGARAPWKTYQNYARDLLTFRTGRIDDGVLRFGRRPGAEGKKAA